VLYRRPTLVLLLALIFLSFFGTLSLSAWMFPGNYDWRYRVISSLLSPRDNPRHYWLAASGVALTAVLMLPFAEHLRRHLQSIAPRMAKMSAAAFTVGIAALISACFVVPQHVQETFGIRRTSGPNRRRMFRSVDVVWVLVRMEWPRSKLDRHYRVLDLVTRDPDAVDRIIRQ
jgi:hypothetical protein